LAAVGGGTSVGPLGFGGGGGGGGGCSTTGTGLGPYNDSYVVCSVVWGCTGGGVGARATLGPCAGTHIRNLAEIVGFDKMSRESKGKDKTRVEYSVLPARPEIKGRIVE